MECMPVDMEDRASCMPVFPRHWDFAVMMVVHLYNRNPLAILDSKSSFEQLNIRRSDYGMLLVFGYIAYPCLQPYRTNKLDIKSVPQLFLGCQTLGEGYIHLDV